SEVRTALPVPAPGTSAFPDWTDRFRKAPAPEDTGSRSPFRTLLPRWKRVHTRSRPLRKTQNLRRKNLLPQTQYPCKNRSPEPFPLGLPNNRFDPASKPLKSRRFLPQTFRLRKTASSPEQKTV